MKTIKWMSLILLPFVTFTFALFYYFHRPTSLSHLLGPFRLPTVPPNTDFQTPLSTNKTILLWTPFFSKNDYISTLDHFGCGHLPCIFTSDRSRLTESAALIFHLRDIKTTDMPPARASPSQVWVLLHHESPPHTPQVLEVLNGLINWTVTYRRDSDILLSPRLEVLSKRRWKDRGSFYGDTANKTRLVAWFVSNCNTPSGREAYVHELQRTISVDIYGSCGDKTCLPKMSRQCLERAAREYYFYLSFENSICPDYVTEKFFDILNVNMIPVVLGGADYASISPPGSYIHVKDFPNPRSLGHFLVALAKDPNRYRRYFAWKSQYKLTIEPYPCQLCQKLLNPPPPKTYHHLDKWWAKKANCTSWKMTE